jgi:hypothetical protein
MKINVGISGSTPIKRFDFDGTLPPDSIPRSSPNDKAEKAGEKVIKPSILNSAERRASSSRRQAHYAAMDSASPSDPFGSPTPNTFGRPKTSRGICNPNPDNFADYVVMSPQSDPAVNGEVMQFSKEAGDAVEESDRRELKQRFDFEESVDSSTNEGWGTAALNNSYDYEESDEEGTGDISRGEYEGEYEEGDFADNIFVDDGEEGGAPEESDDGYSSTGELERVYAHHGRLLLAMALSL